MKSETALTPDAMTSKSTAAEGFRSLAPALIEAALGRARELENKSDAEDFHKLRIALRRLRSLWWAYEPLLDRQDAELHREQFKRLADAAGKTRDWDVALELFSKKKRTRGSFAELLPALDEQRIRALVLSRAAINPAEVEKILQRALDDALEQLARDDSAIKLTDFADERIRSAEKTLRKRLKQAAKSDSDYEALHRVRIAGKQVRYMLEFFLPVLDDSHRKTLERMAELQEELGELNDFVASENLIRHHASQIGRKTSDRKTSEGNTEPGKAAGGKDKGAGDQGMQGDVDEALRWLKRRKRRRIDRAHKLLKRLDAHR